MDSTKIKKVIKRVSKVFWKHLFLTFVLFLLIWFLFGSFIYYKYYLKTKDIGLGETNTILTVNKVLMNDIFSKWDADEILAKKAENKDFPDFFRVIPLETSITTTTTTEKLEE